MCDEDFTAAGDYEPKDDQRSPPTREELMEIEIERQRNIYRPGTPKSVLHRAAINALMDRGEY